MAVRSRKNDTVGLREIASRLNVALSTVSRALAGDRGVGEVKAAAIRAMADQMGYRPRPVRRKHSDTVGLIISTGGLDRPDHNERYVQNIVWWMERLASQLGLHVHVHFVIRDAVRWPSLLHQNRVDGVILAGFPSVDFCQLIRSNGIPAVSISDIVERCGCSAAMVRPQQAMEEVVDRLAAWGHRDIALLSTERMFPVVAASEVAFETAMAKHDLPVRPGRLLRELGANIRGGREGVEKLCAEGKPPTAMIFINDWMALGGVNELHRRGYRIPRDISIVGHDNLSLCSEILPQLTSIDRKVDQVIMSALAMLREQIERPSQSPEQRFIDASTAWRESGGPVGEARADGD